MDLWVYGFFFFSLSFYFLLVGNANPLYVDFNSPIPTRQRPRVLQSWSRRVLMCTAPTVLVLRRGQQRTEEIRVEGCHHGSRAMPCFPFFSFFKYKVLFIQSRRIGLARPIERTHQLIWILENAPNHAPCAHTPRTAHGECRSLASTGRIVASSEEAMGFPTTRRCRHVACALELIYK